jgi:hypothetical protein
MGRNVSESRAGLESSVVEADPSLTRGRPQRAGKQPTIAPDAIHRGSGNSTWGRSAVERGRPGRVRGRDPRRSWLRPDRESERPIVCAGQRTGQEGSSPSGAWMRGAVSEGGGNASPAGVMERYGAAYTGTKAKAGDSQGGPEATICTTLEGRVSAARRDPKGMRRSTGPQSMGATPMTNRSAKGGARSSPHYGGEGALIHPPHQGVCGRHGTEDQYVTPGGLAGSPGGTGGSDPISASEAGSGVLRVVGRPSST